MRFEKKSYAYARLSLFSIIHIRFEVKWLIYKKSRGKPKF